MTNSITGYGRFTVISDVNHADGANFQLDKIRVNS